VSEFLHGQTFDRRLGTFREEIEAGQIAAVDSLVFEQANGRA